MSLGQYEAKHTNYVTKSEKAVILSERKPHNLNFYTGLLETTKFYKIMSLVKMMTITQ